MAVQYELGAGPVRALVRFSGELSTKARRTRSRFQNRLATNLRDAFDAEGIDAALELGWSRFHVESPDAAFLDPLLRTFGVSSCSVLAGECEADLDTIVSTGTVLFAESVRGRSYAVRARRSGSHGFSSSDIQQRLGAALNPGATVDLGDPDITVFVEVRDERVFFHEDRIRGPSGLPLGVQGHALALISGGFDSAVAAWMALRRGIRLDYAFCNLGGSAYERMVVEVTKILADRWSYGTRPRLHVLEFGPVVEAMRARAKPAYLQVVLKRMMYRAAATIGERIGAEAIVTGESVGQVSSQTLRNLRAIENASSLPVLRPLLGFHKEEILDRARAPVAGAERLLVPNLAPVPVLGLAHDVRLKPNLLPVLGEELGRQHRPAIRGIGGAQVEFRALQPGFLEVVLRLVEVVGDLETGVVARELRAQRLVVADDAVSEEDLVDELLARSRVLERDPGILLGN